MPAKDPRTDQDLIAAANGGDASAFETFYDRYRDWVVRLAYRFTGDRHEALDVLQETFAYWLKKFPGFRLSSGVTTFLYPVVKNTALAIRRKRARAISDSDVLDHVPAPDAPPSTSKADLAQVLAILPAAQREVLLMRFVDGMTLAEIAAALAIPLGTVKSRLHHALETLRNDERTQAYFEP